jgi:hypothetical protein
MAVGMISFIAMRSVATEAAPDGAKFFAEMELEHSQETFYLHGCVKNRVRKRILLVTNRLQMPTNRLRLMIGEPENVGIGPADG